MIQRIGEKVFLDLFNSISNGKNRIPLTTAINRLKVFFNSLENPYKKHVCGDSSVDYMTSEQFMDQFYARHVDKRHGLRSQILMVGGTKNLRGNPGGHLDSMLSFPQITFEQFFGIAKDMECIFLEKLVPGFSQRRLTKSYTPKSYENIKRVTDKEVKSS